MDKPPLRLYQNLVKDNPCFNAFSTSIYSSTYAARINEGRGYFTTPFRPIDTCLVVKEKNKKTVEWILVASDEVEEAGRLLGQNGAILKNYDVNLLNVMLAAADPEKPQKGHSSLSQNPIDLNAMMKRNNPLTLTPFEKDLTQVKFILGEAHSYSHAEQLYLLEWLATHKDKDLQGFFQTRCLPISAQRFGGSLIEEIFSQIKEVIPEKIANGRKELEHKLLGSPDFQLPVSLLRECDSLLGLTATPSPKSKESAVPVTPTWVKVAKVVAIISVIIGLAGTTLTVLRVYNIPFATWVFQRINISTTVGFGISGGILGLAALITTVINLRRGGGLRDCL